MTKPKFEGETKLNQVCEVCGKREAKKIAEFANIPNLGRVLVWVNYSSCLDRINQKVLGKINKITRR